MSIKEVLDEQLLKIKLSSEETLELETAAKEFISSLAAKGLKSELGGSLAKGTVVRTSGLQDIDVFVVFEKESDVESLGGILEGMELTGSLKTVHGSRDYFQIRSEGFILEVIPVVANKDPNEANNVTDVSLSHVSYVRREIEKNKGLADEIRVAKAFVRAQKCYGAESYIHGFSGYSLEVLVSYFGSFEKFLKGVSKMKVIDPANHFKGTREVMREINSSKLESPIVVVDPTHKYRNVTAGLREETFLKFLDAANKFLKNPFGEFFELKEIDVFELKDFASEEGAKFVEVKLKTDRQEGDIAGTKMKKFFDFFHAQYG